MSQRLLIDAVALEQALRDEYITEENKSMVLTPYGAMIFNSAIDCALKAVREAEIVDAVEAVHGKWETQGRDATCSVCKYIHVGAYRAMWYSPYCPSCGAKMDIYEAT